MSGPIPPITQHAFTASTGINLRALSSSSSHHRRHRNYHHNHETTPRFNFHHISLSL